MLVGEAESAREITRMHGSVSEVRVMHVLSTCPRCTTPWQGSHSNVPELGDRASYDISVVLAHELGEGSGERLLSPLLPREAVNTIAALLEREPARRMSLEAAIARLEGAFLDLEQFNAVVSFSRIARTFWLLQTAIKA